jgi:outer membrane receptor protein involved in Fe transport
MNFIDSAGHIVNDVNTNLSINRSISALLACAALQGLSAPAIAQTSISEGGESILTGGNDIVVTGSKREARLQDVPIAITALAGDRLTSGQTATVADPVRQAPGVAIQSAGAGRSTYAIRGIASASGSSPTVGFYVDDVPITPPTDTGATGRSFIDH